MQSMDRDKGQDVSIILLIRLKKRNVLIDRIDSFFGGVHNNDNSIWISRKGKNKLNSQVIIDLFSMEVLDWMLSLMGGLPLQFISNFCQISQKLVAFDHHKCYKSTCNQAWNMQTLNNEWNACYIIEQKTWERGAIKEVLSFSSLITHELSTRI